MGQQARARGGGERGKWGGDERSEASDGVAALALGFTAEADEN